MPNYTMPRIRTADKPAPDEIILVASGDLRQSANQVCWPAQANMEKQVCDAFAKEGFKVRRGHPYDDALKHGFISSQRMGMDVFQNIHPEARLIVAEAVWQYSYHVLPGLRSHRGPILTVANWSGQWPGLVGMLNLNACLTKAGVPYSTIWSENFTDHFFVASIRQWLREGKIDHDASHIRPLVPQSLPPAEYQLGAALGRQMKQQKAVLGVFDEGCMGMYNGIIDDELLNPMGIYKERMSQSALLAAMRQVTDSEAQAVRDWLDHKGMKFATGPDPAKDLTNGQILEQCRMYIAAVRMADMFGCDTIGIQYQQGLKDMAPASDLVEGLLNNVERPPVKATDGRELYPGQAVPHFNEVDECAGIDSLVTNRVWTAMGLDPATTLHDIRWGECYQGSGVNDFVWVFEISGAVPPSHLIGGYAGATSERQPDMFFPLGGGTIKGISKPGEVVWSRIFAENGKLHADLGRAKAVELPREETERRWQSTTPQWPMMHAVLSGVSRDQMMGRHKSNHINVVYAPDAETANRGLAAKAAMFDELGVAVHLCGRW